MNNEGLSFSQVLLLVFVILKLCGVINWSWFWVFSPLWILFVVALIIAIGENL